MTKYNYLDGYPLASKFYFDMPEVAEIISWAERLVSQGCASENIEELAFSYENIVDLEETVKGCYKENGVNFPTRREAGLRLAEYYSKKIINKQLTPYEGAKMIWRFIIDQEDFEGEFKELKWFVGLASEFEDFDDVGQREFYGDKRCEELKLEVAQRIFDEAMEFSA